MWLQFKINRLAFLEKTLRVGSFKYPLTIVNFQVRSVLAAMQKNWSLFPQNLYFFRINCPLKLVSIFEFSPVVAAVQNQQTCFPGKDAQSWYLYVSIDYCELSG